MSRQRTLHSEAIEHLVVLEGVIDELKSAGPDSLDRWNALLNTKVRLRGLAERCGTACEVGLNAD